MDAFIDGVMSAVAALVDLIKVIAWPIVVIVLWWFNRAEIGRLIDRIREFGPSGVRADPARQEPALIPTRPAASVSVPQQDLVPGEAMNLAVEGLRRNLPQNVANDQGAAAQYLINLAAALNVMLWHERNYIAIFGSQIRLLSGLNDGTIQTVQQANNIYVAAATSFKDVYANISLAQWLGFVVGGGLCSQQGDKLAPTPFGRNFLQYIIGRQLTLTKPY